MPDVCWNIDGDYLLACNCDWGCPCNFNAPPTPGFCQATLGVVVERGSYDGVPLEGSKAFLTAKWPGAIHEGGGLAAIYVDAPTDRQRAALADIVSGRAGGAPFAIFAATFDKVLGPHFVPIHAKVAGQHSEVGADGRFRFVFEPIRNPVTQADSFPRVVLPQGFIFKEGHQYALKEYWVREAAGLTFTHPGKCAEYAKVSWSNH
jgi:hypothetical protein